MVQNETTKAAHLRRGVLVRAQMRDRPLVTELSVVCERKAVKRPVAKNHPVEIMWMNGGFTVDGVSAKKYSARELGAISPAGGCGRELRASFRLIARDRCLQ
jgi:hypothetical protein